MIPREMQLDKNIQMSKIILMNFLKFRMPISIKNLVEKYRGKHFTLEIYEKYKVYKNNAVFTKQNV